MKSTTIWVSKQVKERLERIKKRNGHKTFDGVIRYLLMKAGEWE